MYKGEEARLRAKKVLRKEDELVETVLRCKVWEYDPSKECIYLILQEGELTDVSLDTIFSCEVVRETEKLECVGKIIERYCNENGKIIKFKIKNK